MIVLVSGARTVFDCYERFIRTGTYSEIYRSLGQSAPKS